MSGTGTKRLSKVAREFNLGINTIVEFLSSKGYKVESNPNSKIDESMYEILMNEFQSDKSAKENAKKVVLEKEKKETISIEEEELITDEEEEEQPPKEELFKNEEKVKKDIKVLGKIDLDSMNLKTRPDKKDKSKPKEQPKEEEKPHIEVKKEEVIDEKPAPPEEMKVEVDKLEGPKVVGKIDLPTKKEKPKPVASSDDSSNKKRKRKRIKQKVDPVNPLPQKGNKKPSKKDKKPELSEQEVQEQIKETLARLTGTSKSKGAKYRREKRAAINEQMQKEMEQQEAEKKVLKVTEFVTVGELASLMDVNVNEIIGACMSLGLFVSINQRLNAETLTLIAEEYGYQIEFISATEEAESVLEQEDKPEDLVERPPIVTVMGHVDHGKTSFLDYVRNTNVIAGEAGGITQHIGAYSVTLKNGKKITFLDTPGHEAFTAMRARGAQVTDVAIIVIAADDAVMPQTKEAINHALAAEVPIVFAINKCDKPNANPDKIKEELSQMNILVEDWGGKYQCQEISSKTGKGIDELLDKVLLEAELLELKANPNKNAVGTVIESELDKGRGYVSTVLIQAGTARVGDIILAGCYSGRIKAMFDERGNKITEAGPSTPVEILGLNGAPTAGDKFHVMDDEREARNIADKRMQLQREQGIRTKKHITLDEIGRRLAIGDFKQLNVIIKGDVDGSIEALSDSLQKLSTEQIQVNIIHKSVGQISESDVMLATASDAIIVGFQVRPSAGARKLAEKEQIDIRLYSIIYDAIEEIKSAMEGMLAPKFEEKITATVEVREVFKITKVGTVAGCMVIDGKINRNSNVRVIRDGIVIYTGKLGSLKRFKDDVKEVQSGYECGLNIENFNDIKVGDIIEAYEQVEVKQKLN
ncbi:MAG: translation initiation factor IF-2 [Vicingaceae bacterium]